MTRDDYSPIIRETARRLGESGGKVKRLATIVGSFHSTKGRAPTNAQDVTPPSVARGHTVMIDGIPVAAWIAPYVFWARDHGWSGRVTSGYRDLAGQREACRKVCGNPNGCPDRCAKPGTSNHQSVTYPGGAVDVTEYEEFARVMNRYPGGPPLINDLPKDRVHFSHTGH